MYEGVDWTQAPERGVKDNELSPLFVEWLTTVADFEFDRQGRGNVGQHHYRFKCWRLPHKTHFIRIDRWVPMDNHTFMVQPIDLIIGDMEGRLCLVPEESNNKVFHLCPGEIDFDADFYKLEVHRKVEAEFNN